MQTKLCKHIHFNLGSFFFKASLNKRRRVLTEILRSEMQEQFSGLSYREGHKSFWNPIFAKHIPHVCLCMQACNSSLQRPRFTLFLNEPIWLKGQNFNTCKSCNVKNPGSICCGRNRTPVGAERVSPLRTMDQTSFSGLRNPPKTTNQPKNPNQHQQAFGLGAARPSLRCSCRELCCHLPAAPGIAPAGHRRTRLLQSIKIGTSFSDSSHKFSVEFLISASEGTKKTQQQTKNTKQGLREKTLVKC